MTEKGFINLFEKTLGVFAFGFVLLPKLVPLFFILLISVVVIGFIKKEVFFQINILSGLSLLFYLCYLVGLFFTHDSNLGVFELEKKLSFVIFPLILSLKSKKTWSLNMTFIGFILGTFIVSIYGIWIALDCFFQPGGTKACLLTSAISPIHHPTYLSAFVFLSIAIAYHGWREKMTYFSMYWIIPFIIFGIVLHGFLLSLSGILFLFIALILILIIWTKKKFSKIVFYTSICIFPLFGFIALNTIPQIHGEWENATLYAKEYIDNPESFVSKRNYPMSGTEVRIVMWTASYHTFCAHPFGVGTGNVDEYLSKELVKLKQEELIHHNYNPHNQFLQTAVEIGFFGLIILFSIVFFGLYYGFKYRNWLLIIIIGSLFFNCLFESMLQRQSGIVFYCFWICLLSSQIYNKEIKLILKD